MTRSCGWSAATVGLLIFMTNTAAAQLMSVCVPDSPERRGEIGCSTIQSKTLPEGLTGVGLLAHRLSCLLTCRFQTRIVEPRH